MSGKSSAESARSSSDESMVVTERENYVLDIKAMKKYMQEMEKYLIKTECVRSGFCEETGLELYLKKEYCQITKSCHARSALCTLVSLSTKEKKYGVITALQEDVLPLCHFGAQLGIPVEIVLPETTLSSKINELKKYKATLTIKGNDLDKAETIASELATEKNMYCIKRNDITRYFGYGTIGIEIIEQVPSVDVIVVPKYEPIYSSIIAVVKVLKPSVVVIIASYKSLLDSSSEASSTSPTSDSMSCQILSPPNISKSSTVSSLDKSMSFSTSNPLSSEPTSAYPQTTASEEELSSETGSTSSSRIVSIQTDSFSGIEISTSSEQVRESIPSSASISESSRIEESALLPPSIHRTLSSESESSSVNTPESSTLSSVFGSKLFSSSNLLSSETESSSALKSSSSHSVSAPDTSDISSGLEFTPSSATTSEFTPINPASELESGVGMQETPSVASTKMSPFSISSRSGFIETFDSSSSAIEPILSFSSIEPPSSKYLRLSSSTEMLFPSISVVSDETSLSTDSMPSRSETSCALAQVASSSQQKGELDNDNVTRVILNEEEVDTAILKLSKKEGCTLDRFGVVSFAACLRACTAGSLFEEYKNKSVVALLANSSDNQIDFVRLE